MQPNDVGILLLLQGLMTDEDCATILTGLTEIERRIEDGEFVWRADREDVHMNVEAALIDLVGEPAKKLHTARSRNDQVVTDVRLWCRDAIDQLLGRIELLQVLITLQHGRTCNCKVVAFWRMGILFQGFEGGGPIVGFVGKRINSINEMI